MSRSTVLLGATTVVLGIAVIYLGDALRTQHERAQALQVRVTELEAGKAGTSVTPPPAATTVTRAVAPTPATAPTPPIATALSTMAAASPEQKRATGAGEMFRRPTSPAYKAAELAYARVDVESQYSDLAEALNLRPDEADRLFGLLAKQELSEREEIWKRSDAGPLPDPAAFRERQRQDQERRKAVEAERVALLGDAKAQELTHYLNSLPARSQIRELRTRLAESSYPLRNDQMTPLVESLAAEQQRHTAERLALYNSARDPTNATAEEVKRHAAKKLELIDQSLQRRRQSASIYLDPEQLKQYEAMLARERTRAQIEHQLVRSANP